MRLGVVLGAWALALAAGAVAGSGGCGLRDNPLKCHDLACFAGDAGGGGGDGGAGCQTAADCTDPGAPLCKAGACVACMTGDDGACAVRAGQGSARLCATTGPLAGQCVQCRQSSDCTDAATPVCRADGSCGPCSSNDQCPSGVCFSDGPQLGRCAAPGDVAHVDNRGMAVTDCKTAHPTADGTVGNEFCDVQDAVDSPTRSIVAVTGHQFANYGGITITDSNARAALTIVGPGRDAAEPAFLNPATTAVVVSPVNNPIALTLQGLVFGRPAGGSSGSGIVCNPAVTMSVQLFVRDSLIQRFPTGGVNVQNCTLDLRRNVIVQNGYGGLSISNAPGITYVALNNVIANNVGASGVKLAAGGRFAFNTVVSNTNGNGNAGVDCGTQAAARKIEASIVTDNQKVNGSQFAGNCTLVRVVTSSDTFPDGVNNIQIAPVFVDAGNLDYRLAPMVNGGQTGCCTNKIDANVTGISTPLPTDDFRRGPRPLNVLWDIGAHEAE